MLKKHGEEMAKTADVNITFVPYHGVKHKKSHDPPPDRVKQIINDLRRCHYERRTEIKRDGKKVTYKVYKSKNPPTEYTIVGLMSKRKVRGRLPKHHAFKLVMREEGNYFKTFFYLWKTIEAIKMSAWDYESHPIKPQDFPLIRDGEKIKIRRTVR